MRHEKKKTRLHYHYCVHCSIHFNISHHLLNLYKKGGEEKQDATISTFSSHSWMKIDAVLNLCGKMWFRQRCFFFKEKSRKKKICGHKWKLKKKTTKTTISLCIHDHLVLLVLLSFSLFSISFFSIFIQRLPCRFCLKYWYNFSCCYNKTWSML